MINIQYQGGKARTAKPISEKILEYGKDCTNFVSLFCGSCAVETKVTEKFNKTVCNDNHKYLIDLYHSLQNGWIPPENITKEQYQYIRDNKDENPALAGFVGFGCSYSGKWFGGYARNSIGRNYAKNAKNTLLRDITCLKDVKFTCKDYRKVEIPKNTVVYCDPPYENTTKYSNENFDTNVFWDYMRKISENNVVLISELKAPDDFVCIWQKKVLRTMDRNKDNYFSSTEKLFIHKKYVKG